MQDVTCRQCYRELRPAAASPQSRHRTTALDAKIDRLTRRKADIMGLVLLILILLLLFGGGGYYGYRSGYYGGGYYGGGLGLIVLIVVLFLLFGGFHSYY
jgi:hypothetical protein